MRKIAIITGASSGIGRQTAIDLSAQNYECVLLGRDLKKLEAVKALCPQSTIVSLDLQNPVTISEAAENILKAFKDLKMAHVVLVNNAGIVERLPFEKTPIESWESQFQTNLFGPVAFTQKILPLLSSQTSARIINVSSTLGLKPIAETSAYSASKAAVNNWTASLALELASKNILVTAICPGIIETPIQSFYKTNDESLRNTLDKMQPLNRVGQPEDISRFISFLGDPKTNWVTGTIIPVDGGILLG